MADDTEALLGAETQDWQCRICLASDDADSLIAPCDCKGSARWVHRECLDEWRAQERVPQAFTHCPTCKFEYRTRTVETPSNRQFYCLVARDSASLFFGVQATLGTMALFIHACDSTGFVPKLYPKHWAETHAAVHLSIGPYYVTAVLCVLAVLGVVGIAMKLTGRMPERPVLRHPPRGFCCSGRQGDCELIVCAPDCPFYCCDACCRICAEGACADCCCSAGVGDCVGSIGELAAGSGEAAVVCVPMLLALLVVFALIGIFVGIFFSTVVFQRIMQKHMHLLHMRSETQRVIVVDLAMPIDIESQGSCCVSAAAGAAAGAAVAGGSEPVRGRCCHALLHV